MPASDGLQRDGYAGPVRIFTRAECREIASYLRRKVPEPSVWEKGRAVDERFLYDLATRPAVLEPVTAALGPDVVLWGLSAVVREPGRVHPWHSDIESCGPEGGFVSVWIGIEKTSRESALQLIAGSHRLGRSVQEARTARSIARDDATPDALLQLARELDEQVRFVQPEMTDGEAIFFDGRLWHGSDNQRRRGERVALLLQYAAAEREVRIPDWDELDWPFRIRAEPLPPVIVVSGSARDRVNLAVPPPRGTTTPRIGAAVHRFDLALDDDPAQPWRPEYAFRGATPLLADMSCHASVLDGGNSPHPPHAHDEEEILIPLHGEADVVIAENEDDPAPRIERLLPGSFVYYPRGQHHTIRNSGTAPIAYLMLKWRRAAASGHRSLETEVVRFGEVVSESEDALWTKVLLEGPTAWLTTLHAHLTVLAPGAGYEPHADAHDVAIVVLEGEIETLGRRIRPLSAVYCGAGELHGMLNPGPEPARYLVFEFHAARNVMPLDSVVRRTTRRVTRVARRIVT